VRGLLSGAAPFKPKPSVWPSAWHVKFFFSNDYRMGWIAHVERLGLGTWPRAMKKVESI
jgi:hypothetical protein